MESCPNCHQQIQEGEVDCKNCGANIAQYQGMVGSTREPVERIDFSKRSGDSGRSKVIGIVVVLLLVAGAGAYFLLPDKLPLMDLEPAKANTSGEDLCEGKEKCVVVTLAPWCGYCRRSARKFATIRDRIQDSGTVGMKAIIGADTRANLEELAQMIGEGAFLDPDRKFWSAAGISRVPRWFLIDEGGSILANIPGDAQVSYIMNEFGLK